MASRSCFICFPQLLWPCLSQLLLYSALVHAPKLGQPSCMQAGSGMPVSRVSGMDGLLLTLSSSRLCRLRAFPDIDIATMVAR